MTSTEGNESHEPSRGLLAGGHPLPSFRPHKYRNCISRSAVMDEHPRPVSPKPGETRTGQPFELILGAKGPASPKESKSVEPHVLKTREAYAIRPRPTSGYTYAQIINRQLTETAEIVQARSLDFVFKLHGDVDDSGSIVLTREQYRALLSDGDLHHALETARILLASRPVVYLGFGLRDPDFLYVRDLLANTYKGGVRDHYALMADVSVAEVDYWRRNYGIHLLSYPTAERIDGSRGHDALIGVL